MTLWRLEWLRLLRTRRWLVLVGIYAFFGTLGPVTARYIEDILERFGGAELAGLQLAEPTPADGILQFTSNASQLGVLAVVIVAAGALSVDANPQIAAFLRSRVDHARRLLWPRYAVSVLAAGGALVLGTGVAWGATALLLGSPDAVAVVVGTAYGAVYLAFAVVVVAAAASVARSVLSAVLLVVGVLVALPVLALLPPLEPWLPSELVAAVDALVAGSAAAGDFWRSAVTALLAVVVLVVGAARRLDRREV